MELVCSKCGRTYDASPSTWRCECGGPFDLVFQPDIDIKKIKERSPDMWRYSGALPVDDKTKVSFGEGMTPMREITAGDSTALVKLDYISPTGSFKDRGMSVLFSHAVQMGISKVVEDSSGNAGASAAAYAARAGMDATVFVPEKAPVQKINQMFMHGAKVKRIPGPRAAASDAAIKAIEGTNSFYASHVWNPYFLHGTKTWAYEVVEQLGWKAPDTVILPIGNGTLFLGAYMGFRELADADVIESLPTMIGVQAENCAPVKHEMEGGNSSSIRVLPTLADGIAIPDPPRMHQILQVLKETHGTVITVGEQAILSAFLELGRMGYYVEPTAAATYAALVEHMDKQKGDRVIVSSLTGAGYKTPDRVVRYATAGLS